MNEIYGQSVCIIGSGREGESVRRFLERTKPDCMVTVVDKKTDGPTYLSNLSSFDTVVRSPGVPPTTPELVSYQAAGGHVTSASNIFFSLVTGVTVGVTGTKGKSTTASLIAHGLSGQFHDVRLVGNIGIPMLDHLEGMTKDTVFVVELSSHQLSDIRYSPHVAVYLPIVPEHQDYYPDVSSYSEAKARMTLFQTDQDIVVYDQERPELVAIVARTKAKALSYSAFDAAPWKTPLFGNAQNIAASVCVLRYLGVSDAVIRRQFSTFTPLPHRLTVVATVRGVCYVNDSLSTVPEATIHALDALGDNVTTLIAGGFDRGLSFELLGKRLVTSAVRTLILFPTTGEKIWESLSKTDQEHRSRYSVSTMEEAVNIASKQTHAGEICLLSPASASYNLFRDYADRGDQFSLLVKKL